MATEIDTVITRFETEADQAIAQTKAYTAALDSAQKTTERLPASAAKADKAVGTLGDRMAAFAKAERQEGRTASFFVSQLDAIAPKGSLASSVLGELTQAMVGGVGLGMALGVVSIGTALLVEHFQAAAKEAKAFAEASVKSVEEAEGRITALRSKVNPFGNVRNVQAAARAALMEMEKELAALQAEAAKKPSDELSKGLEEIQKKITAAKVEITTLGFGVEGAGVLDFNKESQDQRDRHEQAVRQAQETMAALADKVAAENLARADKNAKDLAALGKASNEASWKLQEEEAKRIVAEEQATNEASRLDMAERLRLQYEAAQAEIVLAKQTADQKKQIQEEYQQFMRSSFVDLAVSALNSFKPLLTSSAAYDKAMRAAGGAAQSTSDLSISAFAAMTQNFLANLAMQAGAKAIFELAEGYAAAAVPGMQASAALHFAAAGQYGIVAGVAATGAAVIGATRGMTKAESQAVADFEASQTAGVGGTSTGSRLGSGSSGGTTTVRETVFVVTADTFESPAETARRAARVIDLAKQLDLMKRSA